MSLSEIGGWVSIYLLAGLVLAEILQRRGRNVEGAQKLDGNAYTAVTLLWLVMLTWVLLFQTWRRPK